MNPYTEKLLKRVRDLPLTEIRDLVSHLKYVEEWAFIDPGNRRAVMETAERGEARCIGQTYSQVAYIRKTATAWDIVCEGASVGTAPDVRSAKDMADAELELRGYVLPWRQGV